MAGIFFILVLVVSMYELASGFFKTLGGESEAPQRPKKIRFTNADKWVQGELFESFTLPFRSWQIRAERWPRTVIYPPDSRNFVPYKVGCLAKTRFN